MSSGFCVLRLTSPYPLQFQVGPRGYGMSQYRIPSGRPRLDVPYLTTGLPLPIPGQLADLIASRKGWAFATERHTLLCVTLNPILSGAGARELASSTARAADLLCR